MVPCVAYRLGHRLLAAAFLAVVMAVGFTTIVRAEVYPARPVRIIVPAAAGGGIDFTARLIAERLQTALSTPFVVENRDGGSGNIGSQDVARAKPDGYTLLLTISGFHVTNPAVFPSLQLDPLHDFSGVAMIVRAPHVLVVNERSPFNSLRELVADAAANPGKLTYASPGVGTQSQIASELLVQTQHVQIRAIPYRGTGPALNDLLAGSVDMLINTTQLLIGPLQGGAIKGLAVLNPTRHPLLPDIPTAAEAGFPGLEIDTWYAIYAPAGTPKEIRERLAAAIKSISETEDFQTRIRQSGGTIAFLGPDALDRFTAAELTRWTDIVHKLGIVVQ